MALVKHEIDEIAGLREELDALEHPQFQFVRRSPGPIEPGVETDFSYTAPDGWLIISWGFDIGANAQIQTGVIELDPDTALPTIFAGRVQNPTSDEEGGMHFTLLLAKVPTA